MGMTVYAFSPISEEADAGQARWAWGQSGLQREFHTSQDYIVKHCIKQTKTTTPSKNFKKSYLMIFSRTSQKQITKFVLSLKENVFSKISTDTVLMCVTEIILHH